VWIFKDWTPQSNIRFQRNPDYFAKDEFGNQLPYTDTFEMPRVFDQTLLTAGFRTRQLPVALLPNHQQAVDLQNTLKDIQIVQLGQLPNATSTVLTIHADQPPTNDVRVRQAISKALDRQQIITAIYDGRATWQAGIVIPNTRADLLPEAEFKQLLTRDVNGAKQLLQQAGFTGWKPVMSYGAFGSTSSMQQDLAALVQQQMKEININGDISDAVDIPSVGRFFVEHNKEFAMLPRGGFGGSLNSDLQTAYRKGGARNTTNIDDAQLVQLIDAQAAELKDANKRRDIVYQIERRILELAAPIPMAVQIQEFVQWNWVHNVFLGVVPDDASAWELIWLSGS
jgi:ABC-type transport system substrate-binding protein